MCAACARLHNGIIDYLLTSHNNSAVYLIIGAFQSPTPTRSSPISLTLFESSPPASDNRLVAWVDEAEQRLSILCGVRAALPRRIREREFSVRERRGNRDFSCQIAHHICLEVIPREGCTVEREAQGKSCSSSKRVRVTKQNREKLRRGEETPVALRGRVRLGEGGNHWHSREAGRTTHFPPQFTREASVLLPEPPSRGADA